jgi:glucokinase
MSKSKKDGKLYLGIDVGGTKTLAALVQSSGKILARRRAPTPRGAPEETLATVVQTIHELLAESGADRDALRAIGIAVPGIIGPGGQIVVTPNLNLSGFDMRPRLEREFDMPVALGNDVNLGTLGEQWLGAAAFADSAVGIFVGTGIGGGIIFDGKLVLGHRGAAAEVGHMRLQPGGPLCGCGGHGCLEALASRTAIERDIRDAIAAGRQTRLTEMAQGDLSVIRSNVLKKALVDGDPLVHEVVTRAAETLGAACLQIRLLLDPEVIILGGGVLEACKFFILPIVQKVVAGDAFANSLPGGRIVTATLGDDAVVLGAVALALQARGRDPFAKAKRTLQLFPMLTDLGPGTITVGGETYQEDVYVRVDGKVGRRAKVCPTGAADTPEQIGRAELKEVCKGKPSILIIGTGHDGAAALTPEGEEFLLKRGITYETLSTPEAVGTYNAIKGRKAALIHLGK